MRLHIPGGLGVSQAEGVHERGVVECGQFAHRRGHPKHPGSDRPEALQTGPGQHRRLHRGHGMHHSRFVDAVVFLVVGVKGVDHGPGPSPQPATAARISAAYGAPVSEMQTPSVSRQKILAASTQR